MQILNKSLISLALVAAGSAHAFAATDATSPSTNILADFKNKLLLVPCVEVTGTSADGYYNVLMELSGDGTGMDWKVKQANPVAADECDAPPTPADTNALLKSMGMPSLDDMLKAHASSSKDSAQTTPSTQNPAVTNLVNSALQNALDSISKPNTATKNSE